MIIDAHQHFWQLARGDYGWLTPDLKPLYRDFVPDDLIPLLQRHDVDGTILVQAAPTTGETEFLLEIAEKTPFVLGVVGWTDFSAASAARDIERLAQYPQLVGLRPMIQDIEDDDWMLRRDLAPAFEAMMACNLTFDALVLPRHLPKLLQLVIRYPELRTVIDHAAKPDIAGGQFETWAANIAMIAKESQAYCKLSGLLTEAGTDWTAKDLAPYITHLMSNFGPGRIVWGSDWPVLTMAASYDIWMDVSKTFVLGQSERNKVFGVTALELYNISRN